VHRVGSGTLNSELLGTYVVKEPAAIMALRNGTRCLKVNLPMLASVAHTIYDEMVELEASDPRRSIPVEILASLDEHNAVLADADPFSAWLWPPIPACVAPRMRCIS
jgi:hypothetical protein